MHPIAFISSSVIYTILDCSIMLKLFFHVTNSENGVKEFTVISHIWGLSYLKDKITETETRAPKNRKNLLTLIIRE